MWSHFYLCGLQKKKRFLKKQHKKKNLVKRVCGCGLITNQCEENVAFFLIGSLHQTLNTVPVVHTFAGFFPASKHVEVTRLSDLIQKHLSDTL